MYQTLVPVETVEQHLDDRGWLVFDCRFQLDDPAWGEQEYRRSHLPGAVYAHLDRDLAAPRRADTGRHPLPDPDAFARWLGRCGVGAGTQVVAYDQAGGAFAARLWWLLRWLGHSAGAVMDGGWAAWSAAGFPVTDAPAQPSPAAFEARARDELWLTSDQLERALHDRRARIIDARGAARFRGESEPIDPVAGHLPGAVNLPFTENLDEQGRFLDAAALKQRFESAIADAPDTTVVHMCGSGVTACHNLLAMEAAGLTGSKLYAGSWSEWITDPRRAVVREE